MNWSRPGPDDQHALCARELMRHGPEEAMRVVRVIVRVQHLSRRRLRRRRERCAPRGGRSKRRRDDSSSWFQLRAEGAPRVPASRSSSGSPPSRSRRRSRGGAGRRGVRRDYRGSAGRVPSLAERRSSAPRTRPRCASMRARMSAGSACESASANAASVTSSPDALAHDRVVGVGHAERSEQTPVDRAGERIVMVALGSELTSALVRTLALSSRSTTCVARAHRSAERGRPRPPDETLAN